jgi:hypothetical protein
VTLVEELLGALLPWFGGLAGITVLYMAWMVHLRHQEMKRLARIEELLVLRGKE